MVEFSKFIILKKKHYSQAQKGRCFQICLRIIEIFVVFFYYIKKEIKLYKIFGSKKKETTDYC